MLAGGSRKRGWANSETSQSEEEGERARASDREREGERKREREKGVKAERRKPRKCGGATGETRQKESRVPEGAEGRTRGRLSFVCLAIWTSFAKTFPRRRENGRSLKETPRNFSTNADDLLRC